MQDGHAGHSRGTKKKRTAEENVARQHQGMDMDGHEQAPREGQ